MNFSSKLKNIRKSSGLSQEKLGEKLGVSRQAIAKWEAGSSWPEVDNIIALSEMFDVSTDYLLKDKIETVRERPPLAFPSQRRVYVFPNLLIFSGLSFFVICGIGAFFLYLLAEISPVYVLGWDGVKTEGLFGFIKFHNLTVLFRLWSVLMIIGFIFTAAGLVCKYRVFRK